VKIVSVRLIAARSCGIDAISARVIFGSRMDKGVLMARHEDTARTFAAHLHCPTWSFQAVSDEEVLVSGSGDIGDASGLESGIWLEEKFLRILEFYGPAELPFFTQ